MIKRIIRFIMDFLGLNRTTQKEDVLVERQESLEKEIEKIEEKDHTEKELVDYLNK